MASFIARLIEASGGTLPADAPDAFRDDDGSVHERAIDQLAELGIFTGYPDGRSGAKDRVDRAQMASLIDRALRSEEHTSELQSLMRISYAVFCLTKKIHN